MELREGIIVKTINYKENSKIVYLVTKEGLVNLEVKGANKINGHAHIYSSLLTKIAFSSKKHFFESGKVINNYVSIKSDLDKLKVTLEILEISYTLIEHITDYEIFYNFLDETLCLINDTKLYLFYSSVFYVKLLYLLGINPSLNRCVNCGSKDFLLGFVFEQGGMKCKNCVSLNDKFYDNDVINIIIKMYYVKLNDLKDKEFDFDYESVKAFLNRYYNEYLGYSSKSEKILAKI